jgi:hypothetical protein
MSLFLSPEELPTGIVSQPEIVTKTQPAERVVILQPIAMRVPNRYGIYSPSKLKPKREISYREFLSCYADHSRKIRVCFDETPSASTIFQRSELITAYGSGLDCWYIVE